MLLDKYVVCSTVDHFLSYLPSFLRRTSSIKHNLNSSGIFFLQQQQNTAKTRLKALRSLNTCASASTEIMKNTRLTVGYLLYFSQFVISRFAEQSPGNFSRKKKKHSDGFKLRVPVAIRTNTHQLSPYSLQADASSCSSISTHSRLADELINSQQFYDTGHMSAFFHTRVSKGTRTTTKALAHTLACDWTK